jgi:hypothetical protein
MVRIGSAGCGQGLGRVRELRGEPDLLPPGAGAGRASTLDPNDPTHRWTSADSRAITSHRRCTEVTPTASRPSRLSTSETLKSPT